MVNVKNILSCSRLNVAFGWAVSNGEGSITQPVELQSKLFTTRKQDSAESRVEWEKTQYIIAVLNRAGQYSLEFYKTERGSIFTGLKVSRTRLFKHIELINSDVSLEDAQKFISSFNHVVDNFQDDQDLLLSSHSSYPLSCKLKSLWNGSDYHNKDYGYFNVNDGDEIVFKSPPVTIKGIRQTADIINLQARRHV